MVSGKPSDWLSNRAKRPKHFRKALDNPSISHGTSLKSPIQLTEA